MWEFSLPQRILGQTTIKLIFYYLANLINSRGPLSAVWKNIVKINVQQMKAPREICSASNLNSLVFTDEYGDVSSLPCLPG